MSGDRRKETVRHLSEEDIDRLLAETNDEKVSKRLIFVKQLYKGATLEQAADDVGKSASTGSRWARRWNEGGLGQLTPNFGDGRPPKFGDEQRDKLLDRLREGQPWQPQEIQQLLNDEFDVEYHPVYLGQFLRNLGCSYAIPRPKRPSWPDNADEILNERVDDAFAEDDSETPTTNATETRRKAGSSTMMCVLTAAPSSGFLMHRIHNHMIILAVSGTSTIRTSNER